ncbi:MAG: MBL fold metallo-hydrolase [Candidatus Alcyoniella australis]|nr:MBL fold metallo-hydrolase [Candidatus Alcyoniella australis]
MTARQREHENSGAEANRLRLSVVGSGTCVLRGDRGPTALLFSNARSSLLIDIGPGVARKLADHCDPYGLDAMCLTHLHADHVCDLPALLFAFRNTPGAVRQKPLKIYGPIGLKKHLDLLTALHGHSIAPECGVESVELDPAGGNIELEGGMRLAWSRADHGAQPALSYRVQADGRCAAYSGDSGPCDELVDLARGADLLIAECSATDQAPLPGHLAPSQIALIAKRCAVKRLLLVHLYPESAAADPLSIIGNQYSGEALLGFDGMQIEV